MTEHMTADDASTIPEPTDNQPSDVEEGDILAYPDGPELEVIDVDVRDHQFNWKISVQVRKPDGSEVELRKHHLENAFSSGFELVKAEEQEDAAPIKITWQGDARSKFKGRKVRARQSDGHWTGEPALETLDRLKTRVVVQTEREAQALHQLLEDQARSRDRWTTDQHVKAYERVLSELEAAMEERGWSTEASTEADVEQLLALTDGGEDQEDDVDSLEEDAQELAQETRLSEGEARVYLLKEEGHTHQEVADLLELGKSTVDNYSRRINTKLQEARRTVDRLETPAVDDHAAVISVRYPEGAVHLGLTDGQARDMAGVLSTGRRKVMDDKPLRDDSGQVGDLERALQEASDHAQRTESSGN